MLLGHLVHFLSFSLSVLFPQGESAVSDTSFQPFSTSSFADTPLPPSLLNPRGGQTLIPRIRFLISFFHLGYMNDIKGIDGLNIKIWNK